MNNFLRKIFSATTTPPLKGGLRLPRNKRGLPENGRIETLSLPQYLYLPLVGYRQEFLLPKVRIGQCVKLGESLADGIIAPSDGVVVAIEPRQIIHPSGLLAPCVVVQTSSDPGDHAVGFDDATNAMNSDFGKDALTDAFSNEFPDNDAVNSAEGSAKNTIHEPLEHLTLERIELCGIHGLGGAGFSTAAKLQTNSTRNACIDTLVINAVECEPVISCDEALMMTEATNIVSAIRGLIDMSSCNRCVLAIEEDKHAALAALENALQNDTSLSTTIELQTLAPVYPSGAERPLIERVTGIQIPSGVHCSTLGIVCINVATALATWYAKCGHPMTSRVVTVAGDSITTPTNVRVTFGTTIAEVLKQTGNMPDDDETRVRAGGPLSGFDLRTLDVPVLATTNCITVERARQRIPALPCIRCNACSDVCPVELLPQQLFWFATNNDHTSAARYQLKDCIECGCCDAVCPSGISLTQIFRHAKGMGFDEELKLNNAIDAESRFRRREHREAERAAEREHKRAAAREKLVERSDPIADALSRIRGRRISTRTDEAKASSMAHRPDKSVLQKDQRHDHHNTLDSDKDQTL